MFSHTHRLGCLRNTYVKVIGEEVYVSALQNTKHREVVSKLLLME